ncbi:ChrR family anti-sigma-E factor [Sneathiella chinensis]|uniref:Anti-sigma factor n=1 Tax=Sneathiella chinensis TaxID=349750 RepID=A0ABQ5U189_9PROT|nr:ChrR family anti-sigma-E factor [Sneathiella chinensis]GLQ05940.1 anti-sigma factor [Sneathiella chinensis]
MTIRHHIADDTLMAYVGGTLAPSLSVAVATHLAICPRCRDSVAMMEEVASLYLEETEPLSHSEKDKDAALLDQIMATPRTETAEQGAVSSLAGPAIGSVPRPLADYMPVPLDQVPWKRLVPGISHYPLPQPGGKRKGSALRLLKIAPGTRIPEHSHSGQELTLILEGSYIDEIGRFQKGDIADLDNEIHHQPVADTDQDCICLIATDGPLKFSGIFSRLLQPIIGI